MDTTEYLLRTPLVQWYLQTQERSLDDIAMAARAKGLTFGHAEAINVDDYAVFENGKCIRQGSLHRISWFIDQYTPSLSSKR